MERLQQETTHLKEALAHRPETERVVGMLMLVGPCNADAARAVLSKISQDTNCKIRVLAALVSEEVDAGRGLPAVFKAALRQSPSA